jgi:TubC N-terminal docking domain
MSSPATLLARCRQLGVKVALFPDGSIKVSPPGVLPAELRAALKAHKDELVPLLLRYPSPASPDPPPSSEEAAPERRALLVYSPLLGFSLWLVRDRPAGRTLARQTLQPALLFEDVLVHLGTTPDEVRRALLPALIATME